MPTISCRTVPERNDQPLDSGAPDVDSLTGHPRADEVAQPGRAEKLAVAPTPRRLRHHCALPSGKAARLRLVSTGTGMPAVAARRAETGVLRRKPMASVAIRGVKKAFGPHYVIHGVNVEIADGEFVVLVGPSGCGKSTLLRMIAGLENISAGEIRIGDRVVNTLPPKARDVAMVFQNYALYPHMTVADNMGFSMRLRGAPNAEIDARVQPRRRDPGPHARSSRAIRASSPAASASASPWAAPSCAIPRCSCSTSRCPISTPSCACRCAPRSRRCTSGSRPRRSTSPTTRSRR